MGRSHVTNLSPLQFTMQTTGMYQIFQMRQRFAHRQEQMHAGQRATKHHWQQLHRKFGLDAHTGQFVQLLQMMTSQIVDPLPQAEKWHTMRWQHQRIFGQRTQSL